MYTRYGFSSNFNQFNNVNPELTPTLIPNNGEQSKNSVEHPPNQLDLAEKMFLSERKVEASKNTSTENIAHESYEMTENEKYQHSRNSAINLNLEKTDLRPIIYDHNGYRYINFTEQNPSVHSFKSSDSADRVGEYYSPEKGGNKLTHSLSYEVMKSSSSIDRHSSLENGEIPEREFRSGKLGKYGVEVCEEKYLSLEIKNQELTGQVKEYQIKLEVANRTIEDLNMRMLDMEQYFKQEVSNAQNHVLSNMDDARKDGYNQLLEKDHKISYLVNCLTSELEGRFEGELKHYIEDLQNKNMDLYHQNSMRISEFERMEKECEFLKESVKRLEGKEQNYKNCIRKLNEEFNNVITSLNFKNRSSYETVIKAQVSELSELRKLSDEVAEENLCIQEKFYIYQKQIEEAQKQICMSELKERTEKNKLVTELSIDLNNKINQIDILKKKISTLEDRYQASKSDIKAKDDFFRNHILGKTSSDAVKSNISSVLDSYTENMNNQLKTNKELEDIIKNLEIKLSLYECA